MKALKFLVSVFFIALAVGALFCSPAQAHLFSAPTSSQIELSQLKKGSYWVWTYSEYRKETSEWLAYLDERYTVTETNGNIVTIEMSSTSAGLGGAAPAHHKFIIDFKKCQLEAMNPTYRHWTLLFYTKSFSGNWDVVSNVHTNLVFTEKFNCGKPSPAKGIDYSTFDFAGAQASVFQKRVHTSAETSWYILSHPVYPELKGLASGKFFKPDDLYQQKLTAFGAL